MKKRDLYYERIPTKLLREDIRLLGTFLGRVIKDQEGEDFFNIVEKLRLLSKNTLLDKNKKVSPDKITHKIFTKKNISKFGVNKLMQQLYAVKSQGNFTSDGTPYLYLDLFKKDFLNKHLFSKKKKLST